MKINWQKQLLQGKCKEANRVVGHVSASASIFFSYVKFYLYSKLKCYLFQIKEGKASTACLLTKQKVIASPSGPAEHNILTVEQHKVRTIERTGGCHGPSPRACTRKGLGEPDQHKKCLISFLHSPPSQTMLFSVFPRILLGYSHLLFRVPL